MGRLTAIVLGAAAGGGFPQWNCRCAVCRLAWAGDTRVKPRTQASLAVSADGEHWILLNASPDLRAQIQATPTSAAARRHARGSPIAAVVLTGAEVDQTAGLLQLARALAVCAFATAATLAAIADNPMFRRARPRRGRAPRRGSGRALCARPTASRRSCSPCPARCRFISKATIPTPRAKAPPMSASRLSTARARLAYVPGAAAITPARDAAPRPRRRGLVRRHAVYRRRDDRDRHRHKNRPAHGPHAARRPGRLARGARRLARAAHLHAHQQHQSDPDRRLARTRRVDAAGLEVAEDGLEIVL